jgi:transposase-like protein
MLSPTESDRERARAAAQMRPIHHLAIDTREVRTDVATSFFLIDDGYMYRPLLVPTPPREEIRRARWPAGVACPRCGSASVVKWGRYGAANHQRYRCVAGCRRTFNDLTQSPLARTRRYAGWGPNVSCLLAGRSIRYTARRIGVAPSTAFRWRHRLLAAWTNRDGASPPVLSSMTGVTVFHLPHSLKGARAIRRSPRRRGLPRQRRVDATGQVPVLLAADASGRLLSHTSGTVTPLTPSRVVDLLAPLLAFPVKLRVQHCTIGLALGCRLGVHWRPRLVAHDPAVYLAGSRAAGSRLSPDAWQVGLEFRRWLSRFHGVASRYLSHYLALHRFLARRRHTVSRAAAVQLLLGAAAGAGVVA